jgi:microcystin-dependent protein
MILMFNGITAPAGWAYCDGTNGTPDLRDRFVICSTATYPLGSTGGSLTSTLALANLPDHIHGQNGSISGNTGDLGTGGQSFCGPGGNTTGISSPGWTPTPTPVSIVPPYYALAYIMKL